MDRFAKEQRVSVKVGAYTISPRHQEYGYWVVKDGCNTMPGACWFPTVKEARVGIRALELAQGDADTFWLLLGNADLNISGPLDGPVHIIVDGAPAEVKAYPARKEWRTVTISKLGGHKNINLNPVEALKLSIMLKEAAERALGKKI